MATIYSRGSRWYLNWFEGGVQRRQSLGKITRDDALKFAKGKEFELATGRRVFTASAVFEEHLDRYLAWHHVQFPHSHFRVK
jgi:hypothetical protein